jgi:hypothetical protein
VTSFSQDRPARPQRAGNGSTPQRRDRGSTPQRRDRRHGHDLPIPLSPDADMAASEFFKHPTRGRVHGWPAPRAVGGRYAGFRRPAGGNKLLMAGSLLRHPRARLAGPGHLCFCGVTNPSGLVLHRCGVFRKHGRTWASPPSKPVIGRDDVVQGDGGGKVRSEPTVSFRDRATSEAWIAAVAALSGAAPEAAP